MRVLHILYRFLLFIKFAALKNVNPYGNNFDIKYLQYLYSCSRENKSMTYFWTSANVLPEGEDR